MQSVVFYSQCREQTNKTIWSSPTESPLNHHLRPIKSPVFVDSNPIKPTKISGVRAP